jgi:hypothetical protein
MNDPMGPPHGPLGLIEVPFYVLWSDYLLLAVLHVLVLGGGAWWLYRLKARKRAAEPAPSPETERWRTLLNQLEALSRGTDPTAQESRAIALRVSACVRQALVYSYGVKASSQTVAELSESLGQNTSLPLSLREELMEFFHWAETVQFSAAQELSREQAIQWVQRARTWCHSWQEGRL